MPLETGIEAAGSTVIETQPIPKNKNTGDHEHPGRRSNCAPFQKLAAAFPCRHRLGRTDHCIRQRRL